MNQTYSLSKSEQLILKDLSATSFNPKVVSPTERPSKQTINNILNYSKALNIQKSEHLKHIEIILN